MAGNGGISNLAQTGFAQSAAYDEHRPTYPPKPTQYLLEQLRVAGKKHVKILDLAAGTGKFTEGLVHRDEGYEIIAIEPHDGMRDVLEQKNLPGVVVKAGTAEKIPLDDESVDAVVAAQVGLLSLLSLRLRGWRTALRMFVLSRKGRWFTFRCTWLSTRDWLCTG